MLAVPKTCGKTFGVLEGFAMTEQNHRTCLHFDRGEEEILYTTIPFRPMCSVRVEH